MVCHPSIHIASQEADTKSRTLFSPIRTKKDMLHNDYCPDIKVNSQTFEVFINDILATCEPATKLPLAQLYLLR